MIRPQIDSQRVSEEEYPVSGTAAQKLRFLVNYAVLAPSTHNRQPWLFFLGPDYIDLYADWSRALPIVDPKGRELILSCGAALSHLRLALRHFGHEALMQLLPAPDDPALLARIRLGEASAPTAEENRLFAAIAWRHTNRLSFEERPLPPDLLAQLELAAEEEGAWLQSVEPAVREELRHLIEEADRQLAASVPFRREMEDWIGVEKEAFGEGMPTYPRHVADIVAYSGALSSPVDPETLLAAQSGKLAAQVPQIVALYTDEESIRDWIAAGQALDRVLLRAAADEVSACFLNEPIQAGEAFLPRLRHLLNISGCPHTVLGLGYGPSLHATPRRPVEEMLIHERPKARDTRHGAGAQQHGRAGSVSQQQARLQEPAHDAAARPDKEGMERTP